MQVRKPAPDASDIHRQNFKPVESTQPDHFFKSRRVERRIPREIALMKKNIPAIHVKSKYEDTQRRTKRHQLLTSPSVDGRASTLLDPPLATSRPQAFTLPLIPSNAPIPSNSARNRIPLPKLPMLTFNVDRELDLHPADTVPETQRTNGTKSNCSRVTSTCRSSRVVTATGVVLADPETLSEYDGEADKPETDREEMDRFHAALKRWLPRHERKELVEIDSEKDVEGDDQQASLMHPNDEEAASRVLKAIFQLNLTKSSNIIQRLRELDPTVLQRRIAQELGPRKQVSKDEFAVLIGKLLRDDHVNRRDCLSLFSVFDDDKSGMVDAVEFVGGFMSLIASGQHDIAYKFLATLLEGREKLTVNAFISRFELQVLLEAAKQHYYHDQEIVDLIDSLRDRFRYEHHLGRMPIAEIRSAILDDEDLKAIFTGLPNPVSLIRDAQAAAPRETVFEEVQQNMKEYGATENDWMKAPHFEADKWINSNAEKQQGAEEHDSPEWWVSGETIFRKTKSNPNEEPIFMREK